MNIDPKLLDDLNETVTMFLDEGRMFSVYNITRVTRERLGIKLRHSEINPNMELHNLQILQDVLNFGHDKEDDGDTIEWTRSEVKKKNSNSGEWFYVYHQVGDDPQNFEQYDDGGGVMVDSQKQQYTAPAVGASITATGQSQDDNKTSGQNSDGTFSPDSYKRLFIPTRFIREAGMSGGDTCHILPDAGTNTIVLVKDPSLLDTDGLTVTTKTVEKNGDIRLRSNTLNAAGLGSDTKFVIENDDEDDARIVRIKAEED